MICGVIGFTFWRCSALLVSIEMIQIWAVDAASVGGKNQCFQCDETSPCLEQQYVCNSVPDCANGRDEQTTKGGGCHTEDDEDGYMLPIIYVIVCVIVLEITGVFAMVMYILNVHCCKLACNLKSLSEEKRRRSTRRHSEPVKCSRTHAHSGRGQHFYIKTRRDYGKPFHIPQPIFYPIVPQTVDAKRQRQYYDSNSRLMWPQSNYPVMTSSPSSGWADHVPLTMPTVIRMSTDENEAQTKHGTDRKTRPEPQTIPNASCDDRDVIRWEPQSVVHNHHTTVNHLTVLVHAQPEMAGRINEAANRATLNEISDQPGASDGRTASASDKQILPLHRARKGTNMYDIENLY